MINKLDFFDFLFTKPRDKLPCLLPERIQVLSYLHGPTQTWKPHRCLSRGAGRSPFLSSILPSD